jgi:hypothetical protein|nr:MAG TPA: Helix-turn-helix XRE-family like protein [Caudoviricetes sp.]DAY16054.1 MAG TPA: Helix-turn-helix XRE-family like protein [Caudoviricetes sp.]
MDIKKVIKERGYTIEDVAKKMGISRVTLSQNMSRNPTVGTLERIANAINCNVSEFFTDEKDATNTIICPHCGEKIVLEAKKEPNNIGE